MPPYKKKGPVGKAGICKFFQQGACFNKRCPFLHVKEDRLQSESQNGVSNILSAMLKLFFEKQRDNIYCTETRTLNLSSLSSHPDLKEIASSLNFNTKVFCNAVSRCVGETLFPPPIIFRFDMNNINTIGPLCDAFQESHLSDSVQALSFADNQIHSVDALEKLKGFLQLREINFKNNPIAAHPDYKQRVRKIIPSIITIDCESSRAPLLSLPWPKFYPVQGEATEGSFKDGNTLYYTALQSDILRFVHTSVMKPLETSMGVDTVSEFYSRNAMLSISFDNSSAVSSESVSTKDCHRNVIRELVAFRLRQTETNHNLLMGFKSKVVAIGRVSVCATMESCMYPKNFIATHTIHPSTSVTVLDSSVENGGAILVEPLSLVTMHGTICWRHCPTNLVSQPNVLEIRRRFSRTFSIIRGPEGKWNIVNDMIQLLPLKLLSDQSVEDLTKILYTPCNDSSLVTRFSRLFNVPEPVVAAIASNLGDAKTGDTFLGYILNDLSGVPLTRFEHAASLLNGDAMGGIMLCRILNVFGVDEETGVQLLHQNGLNWDLLSAACASRAASN